MIDFLNQKTLKQRLGGRTIYLVGMMGSGKSHTGPYLAKSLDYVFVDADDVLEKSSGKSISMIFSEEGEDHFRDLETQVIKEIGKHHSLIVATGGGVVTRPENWGVLHQGIVVWLNLERNLLLSRLQQDSVKRPLLEKENFTDNFNQIFEQRKSLYSESDLEVSIVDESPKEISDKIIELLPGILNDPEAPNALQTIESENQD